jgi:hypothetical protein
MFTNSTKFRLAQNQLSSNIADETIILNHQDGVYYGLNETGTFIWDKLKEQSMSYKNLLNEILDAYEVDKDDAEIDLKDVIEQMLNEKLIEIV